MNPREMYAIDTQLVPWEERFNEKIGRALFRKVLYTDPDNGAEIPGRTAGHSPRHFRSGLVRLVPRGRTHGTRGESRW